VAAVVVSVDAAVQEDAEGSVAAAEEPEVVAVDSRPEEGEHRGDEEHRADGAAIKKRAHFALLLLFPCLFLLLPFAFATCAVAFLSHLARLYSSVAQHCHISNKISISFSSACLRGACLALTCAGNRGIDRRGQKLEKCQFLYCGGSQATKKRKMQEK
jgi:hypothetical protein